MHNNADTPNVNKKIDPMDFNSNQISLSSTKKHTWASS